MARPNQPSRGSPSETHNQALTQGSSTPFGEVRSSSAANMSSAGSSSWCGPFSVARDLIRKREQAKVAREAKLERRKRRREVSRSVRGH